MAAAVATVLAACVAALAALAVERYARRAQRVSQAKVVLDRYRGPLRSAAWELGDRIDNFHVRGFLVYTTAGNPRTDQARASTAFRFEQYFRCYETLRCTFSTSCRRAGDDVFRCQTTTRDGRVADYRVVLGADDCWLGHPVEAGSTAPRPRAVYTGCLDR
jgi:hypothetical protein